MTVEIREDGGVRITATAYELAMLARNAEAAVRRGEARAPFLMETGVAEFVIEVESSAIGPTAQPMQSAS